jgi:hypothetical protein
MTTSIQPHPNLYTLELRENDVLSGRGATVFKFSGNVAYLQLVNDRRDAFKRTRLNSDKERLANEIIEIVRSRNGRFVREIRTTAEARNLSIRRSIRAWVFLDQEMVLKKVKQCLREVKLSSPKQTQLNDSMVEQRNRGIPQEKFEIAAVSLPESNENRLSGEYHPSGIPQSSNSSQEAGQHREAITNFRQFFQQRQNIPDQRTSSETSLHVRPIVEFPRSVPFQQVSHIMTETHQPSVSLLQIDRMHNHVNRPVMDQYYEQNMEYRLLRQYIELQMNIVTHNLQP